MLLFEVQINYHR